MCYCNLYISVRFDTVDRIRSFLYLPLVERLQRDDVDTIACRVRSLGAKSETCRCRQEKSSEAVEVTQNPLLTPVKLGRRPTRTTTVKARYHSSCNSGLVIRIVLIISVFSISKNNEGLLPERASNYVCTVKKLRVNFPKLISDQKQRKLFI